MASRPSLDARNSHSAHFLTRPGAAPTRVSLTIGLTVPQHPPSPAPSHPPLSTVCVDHPPPPLYLTLVYSLLALSSQIWVTGARATADCAAGRPPKVSLVYRRAYGFYTSGGTEAAPLAQAASHQSPPPLRRLLQSQLAHIRPLSPFQVLRHQMLNRRQILSCMHYGPTLCASLWKFKDHRTTSTTWLLSTLSCRTAWQEKEETTTCEKGACHENVVHLAPSTRW